MTKRLTRHDTVKLSLIERDLAKSLANALDLIAPRPDIAGKIADALSDVRFIQEKAGQR